MVQSPVYVEAPPVTPLPYGLLSAALVVEESGPPRWLMAGFQWEPDYCGPAYRTADACWAAMQGEELDDKTIEDGIGTAEGVPLVAYHLFRCRMPGGVIQRGSDRARAALRLGEQRAVEEAVSARLPHSAGALNLTPVVGTAVHPVDGLALLEQYAAANYGGVPVVHVPRGIGTILTTEGAVIRGSGNPRLETVQGALVASGGGYTDLEGPAAADPEASASIPAAAGDAWMFVTGQVVARRSAVIEVNETAGARVNNEFMALAERPYAVAWECITAAVLVNAAYYQGATG